MRTVTMFSTDAFARKWSTMKSCSAGIEAMMRSQRRRADSAPSPNGFSTTSRVESGRSLASMPAATSANRSGGSAAYTSG